MSYTCSISSSPLCRTYFGVYECSAPTALPTATRGDRRDRCYESWASRLGENCRILYRAWRFMSAGYYGLPYVTEGINVGYLIESEKLRDIGHEAGRGADGNPQKAGLGRVDVVWQITQFRRIFPNRKEKKRWYPGDLSMRQCVASGSCLWVWSRRVKTKGCLCCSLILLFISSCFLVML
jgi:hypothetical protein